MSENKKKPGHIHSIRVRMTVIFSLVLIVALAACMLANMFFLERYYIKNKMEALKETYQYLNEASAACHDLTEVIVLFTTLYLLHHFSCIGKTADYTDI